MNNNITLFAMEYLWAKKQGGGPPPSWKAIELLRIRDKRIGGEESPPPPHGK